MYKKMVMNVGYILILSFFFAAQLSMAQENVDILSDQELLSNIETKEGLKVDIMGAGQVELGGMPYPISVNSFLTAVMYLREIFNPDKIIIVDIRNYNDKETYYTFGFTDGMDITITVVKHDDGTYEALVFEGYKNAALDTREEIARSMGLRNIDGTLDTSQVHVNGLQYSFFDGQSGAEPGIMWFGPFFMDYMVTARVGQFTLKLDYSAGNIVYTNSIPVDDPVYPGVPRPQTYSSKLRSFVDNGTGTDYVLEAKLEVHELLNFSYGDIYVGRWYSNRGKLMLYMSLGQGRDLLYYFHGVPVVVDLETGIVSVEQVIKDMAIKIRSFTAGNMKVDISEVSITDLRIINAIYTVEGIRRTLYEVKVSVRSYTEDFAIYYTYESETKRITLKSLVNNNNSQDLYLSAVNAVSTYAGVAAGLELQSWKILDSRGAIDFRFLLDGKHVSVTVKVNGQVERITYFKFLDNGIKVVDYVEYFNEEGELYRVHVHSYDENGDQRRVDAYSDAGRTYLLHSNHYMKDENGDLYRFKLIRYRNGDKADWDRVHRYAPDGSPISTEVYNALGEDGTRTREKVMYYRNGNTSDIQYIYYFKVLDNGAEVVDYAEYFNEEGELYRVHVHSYDENGDQRRVDAYSDAGRTYLLHSNHYMKDENGDLYRFKLIRYRNGDKEDWGIIHRYDESGKLKSSDIYRQLSEYGERSKEKVVYYRDGDQQDIQFVIYFKRADGKDLMDSTDYFNEDGTLRRRITYMYDESGLHYVETRLDINYYTGTTSKKKEIFKKYELCDSGSRIIYFRQTEWNSEGEITSEIEKFYSYLNNGLLDTLEERENGELVRITKYLYDEDGNLSGTIEKTVTQAEPVPVLRAEETPAVNTVDPEPVKKPAGICGSVTAGELDSMMAMRDKLAEQMNEKCYGLKDDKYTAATEIDQGK